MANRELAQRILDAISQKPEAWDQTRWASFPVFGIREDEPVDEGEGVNVTCGTSMCIAGWACHLSGEKVDWASGTYTGNGDYLVTHLLKGGGTIEDRARELLDLDWEEVSDLFHTYTNADAKAHLEDLIAYGYIPS